MFYIIYNKLIFAFIFIFLLTIVKSSTKDIDIDEDSGNKVKSKNLRDGRIFSINWSQFPPRKSISVSNKCYVSKGDVVKERIGYCISSRKCASARGVVSSETCNSQFGTKCCILQANTTESVTITKNYVYLIHKAGDPKASTDFMFPKQDNICQLRLDFKTFKLAQPSAVAPIGVCNVDAFTMKDYNINSMKICGNAVPDYHHMYLHYGSETSLKIKMDVTSSTGEAEILVTQIKCNSADRAPDKCSQYFTANIGEVRSFNNIPDSGAPAPRNAQLNDQFYAICIKNDDEIGTKINWSACPLPDQVFIAATTTGTTCRINDDKLIIPGTTAEIYCDINMNAAGNPVVTTNNDRIFVELDATETKVERGFCLKYTKS